MRLFFQIRHMGVLSGCVHFAPTFAEIFGQISTGTDSKTLADMNFDPYNLCSSVARLDRFVRRMSSA